MKHRIGFLYNHDEVHQVAHTAPIIAHLLTLAPELEIDVLTGNDAQEQAVRAHLKGSDKLPGFVPLRSSTSAKILERAIGNLIPLDRLGRLAASKAELSQYDALVMPETTSTLIKTRLGLKAKLIHMPHGVGDRSIAVTPEIARFDFVMLPGKKTRNRMIKQGVARAEDSAVVGYPKFDALREERAESFFDNDRPTVLYNPHFDPKLSSWFKYGQDVLEYFANQDRFNLIFAPHVMLCRRKISASIQHRQIRFRPKIPARFYELPHMLIDTGSERSVDMSYTRSADIYIGDVSSQIYEFIQQSRPAIFLNSHGADWQNDPSYEFWQFGPVVENIAGMAEQLKEIMPIGPQFKAAQEDAFNRSISVDPKISAGERGARAIIAYLERELG